MRGRILCIFDGFTHENFVPPQLLKDYEAGFFAATPTGFMPESMPCILHLLGLAANEIPQFARGWLEALGDDIAVQADDLIVRASWVNTDAAGQIISMAQPQNAPKAPWYHAMGDYKALICVPNAAAFVKTMQTFPPHRHMGEKIDACMPRGCAPLAALLRKCGSETVRLVPWGQSVACTLPHFCGDAVAVSAIPLVRGIAKAMGMHAVMPDGASGDTDTDIDAKVRMALHFARQGKFVLLHFNGADEAAHRKNAAEKAAFSHKLITKAALPLLQSEISVRITADHGTSPHTGRHVEMPQPVWQNFASTGEKSMRAVTAAQF